jgi:acetyl-CoA carboxylase beta subunit
MKKLKKATCRFCKSLVEDLKVCKKCGKSDPLGIKDEIRSLVAEGKQIEAISKVVKMSRLGLKVSKEYVDSLE